MNDDVYPRIVPGYFGDSRVSSAQIEFILDALPHDGTFLEIGSASGATAAIIADARPHVRVICVDTYIGLETYTDVLLRLIDWRRNQRPNMALWLGPLPALDDWLRPARAVDVAFIDPEHTYRCTYDCLAAAAPMTTQRGALIAHDWLDPNWPEVAPAVRDFAAASGFRITRETPGIVELRRYS
jgi:predicted O-methyltransferase YrrM